MARLGADQFHVRKVGENAGVVLPQVPDANQKPQAVSADLMITFHDFGAPITITAPASDHGHHRFAGYPWNSELIVAAVVNPSCSSTSAATPHTVIVKSGAAAAQGDLFTEGYETGKPLHDIVVKERKLMTQEKWDEVFSFENLISPRFEQ